MGEAKWRQTHERNYGRAPKTGRGLILAAPVTITGGGTGIRGGADASSILALAIRRGVLYWDKLCWPENAAIGFGRTPDIDFLVSEGVMECPFISDIPGGFMGEVLLRAQMQAFAEKERIEPGAWAVSHFDQDNFGRMLGAESAGRGTLVTLFRALPVPDDDVALEDILRFKERRRDEFDDLSIEMNNIFSRLKNSGDFYFDLRNAILDIDRKCKAAVEVAKESKLKFRVSDMKLGFSVSYSSIFTAPILAALGGKLATSYGLPMVGEIVGGAAPFFSFDTGIGLRARGRSMAPFSLVGEIHERLF